MDRTSRDQRSAEDVRLDSLSYLAEELLPELDTEWPDLCEDERIDADYEWSADTANFFGPVEKFDRGVSPWRDPDHALDARQRKRYAALERAFREAMPIIRRLDLSTQWFPPT